MKFTYITSNYLTLKEILIPQPSTINPIRSLHDGDHVTGRCLVSIDLRGIGSVRFSKIVLVHLKPTQYSLTLHLKPAQYSLTLHLKPAQYSLTLHLKPAQYSLTFGGDK